MLAGDIASGARQPGGAEHGAGRLGDAGQEQSTSDNLPVRAASQYALRNLDDLSGMVAVAAATTPAQLEKAVNSLRFGWDRDRDPDVAQARLATILRAFTTSSQTKCLFQTKNCLFREYRCGFRRLLVSEAGPVATTTAVPVRRAGCRPRSVAVGRSDRCLGSRSAG